MISLKNTLEAIGNKISAINSSLGNVPHRTLLWTNPNPTSSFAPQTISLDLTYYDQVLVVARTEDNFAEDNLSLSSPTKSGASRLYGINQNSDYLNTRSFLFDDSGVTFAGGAKYNLKNNTALSDNTVCIPYQIYGIKYGGGYSLASLLRGWRR